MKKPYVPTAQRGTRRLQLQALHVRSEADAKAPQFFVLQIESRNFRFEAYGTTADSCVDTMRRALAAHAIDYRLHMEPGSPNLEAWIDSMIADEQPKKRAMGEGYRDGGDCLTGGR